MSLKTDSRIPELDGLRGVAVLMVIVWHFVGVMVDPASSDLQALAYNFLRIGRTGVDLFFVLSGFLITGIVLDRQSSCAAFMRAFYVRRALRILPPYLLLVAAFWLLVSFGMNNRGVNADTPVVWHLTLTQNWWMATNNTLGPDAMSVTWSVAIEEQYYLLAPLTFLLAPRRVLPGVLIGIALMSAVARAQAYSGPDDNIAAYVFTLYRLDGLALGGLVAWLWRHPRIRSLIESKRNWITQCVAVWLIGLVALLVLTSKDIAWHMYTWGHLFLSAFYAWLLLVILLHLQASGTSLLRSPRLRFFGSISYTLYLFHPCVFGFFLMILGRRPVITDMSDWLVVAFAIGCSVMLCVISRDRVESRFIAIGRRYSY